MLGKVLITGGSGFLGCHLARLLVAQGVVPLLASRRADVASLPPDLRGAVRLATVDLCQADEVEALLQRERPSTIFHLAGARGRHAAAAARCAEVNVAVTARILDAALRYGVSHVIMTGTAEEYGPQPAPQRETLQPQPTTLYGITKACGTALALTLAEQGCPVTVLRPFTVYGPGQPSEMFLASAVEAAIAGRPFQMTEGRQRRDLVFATDVAEALLAAALRPATIGRVINIGSGVSYPLCEIARRIWALAEASSPLEIGARLAPAHELYDTCADLTLAQELLDWQPRIDLDTGLRSTVEHCRNQHAARS